MRKNILFITALHKEAKVIKKIFGKKIKNYTFHYLVTGIGNYKAILETSLFLSKNTDIDFVINIGVCGYNNQKNDIIQIFRIKNLHSGDELLTPTYTNIFPKASIHSSEKMVTYFSKNTEKNMYFDMESYGLELTLEKFFLPRIYIKVPIDKIGKETIDFYPDKACEILEKQIDSIKILDFLDKFFKKNGKNPQEKGIDFSNRYLFTFTEKQNLQKYAGALKALGGKDIHSFFEENKHREKKDFLKKLTKLIQELQQKRG